MEPAYRDYEPLHPRGGTDWRALLRKIWAPIAALVAAAAKFGFLFVKFASLFVAIGGYALIWGWKFAIGFVALILIHEMGHFLEAKRQGLEVTLPTFIPFFGAYVTVRDAPVNPWRNALVSLAGPGVGGAGCLAFLLVGEQIDSDLLRALAYFGFLINLFNLLPIGFLDGGSIWRSIQLARRVPAWTPQVAATAPYSTVPGGGHTKALHITILYVGLAALLLLGMVAAHVPQHRL